MVIFGIGENAQRKIAEFEARLKNVHGNLIEFFEKDFEKKCKTNFDNAIFLLAEQEKENFVDDAVNLPEVESHFKKLYDKNEKYRLVVEKIIKSKKGSVKQIEQILVEKYFGKDACERAWALDGDWDKVVHKLSYPSFIFEEDKVDFADTFNLLLDTNRTFEEWTEDQNFLSTLNSLMIETSEIYDDILITYDKAISEYLRKNFVGFAEFEKFINKNVPKPEAYITLKEIVKFLINNSTAKAYVNDLSSESIVKSNKNLLVCPIEDMDEILEHENIHIAGSQISQKPILGRYLSFGLSYFDYQRRQVCGTEIDEVLTDFFARYCRAKACGKVFDYNNADGFKNSYQAVFPILGDFFVEHMSELKKFYMNNDILGLVEFLGDENYAQLCTDISILIKENVLDEDIVKIIDFIKKLKQFQNIKQATSYLGFVETAKEDEEFRKVVESFENLELIANTVDSLFETKHKIIKQVKGFSEDKFLQLSAIE